MNDIRTAFDTINKARRLPIMLEKLLEDLHKSEHLIAREVEVYMNLYESNSDTETIKALIFRLVEWYNAWKPTPERVLATYTRHLIGNNSSTDSAIPS
ncbi:hypothetical protein PAXINDRAFT_97875 [Paxillus involutus ATCC 200175]|nr:hypothetical protein PAXINDRAFT_97875 [Paxillus involutus ATCC 200175]